MYFVVNQVLSNLIAYAFQPGAFVTGNGILELCVESDCLVDKGVSVVKESDDVEDVDLFHVGGCKGVVCAICVWCDVMVEG